LFLTENAEYAEKGKRDDEEREDGSGKREDRCAGKIVGQTIGTQETIWY
jgi:hypothetical protein